MATDPHSLPQVIDISGWQDGTPINYQAVKEAGIVGIIIKSTDGSILINPFYNRDANGFNSVGIPVASYHFFEPAVDIPTQVRTALNNQNPASQGIWLDLETQESLSWDQIANCAKNFLQGIANAGVFTGIYLNKFWREALEPFGFPWGFPFWYAFPESNGELDASCQLQQYQQVPIPGIEGNVDINALYVPLQEIFPRAQSSSPPIPSTPVPSQPVPIPSSPSVVNVLPELTENSTDTFHVQLLQSTLNLYGAGLAVDGSFGPMTLNSVRNFQTQSGIGIDGIVGPVTWGHLFRV